MTRKEMESSKNLTELSPHCMTGQFSTIKLSEKSRLNTCPHCPKSFVKPSGLKAHIYSHTGEKPHQCPTKGCHRQFSLLSNLRRHIKTHSKAEEKARSSPTKRSILKILPLLSASISNGIISCSAGANDKPQPPWNPNQSSSCISSLPIALMKPSAPMESDDARPSADGYNQPLFPLLDWMDPTYLSHHNAKNNSKGPDQIQATKTCAPDYLSIQQDLTWIDDLDQLWKQQFNPPEEQQQQVNQPGCSHGVCSDFTANPKI